jgi:hypothetical protein
MRTDLIQKIATYGDKYIEENLNGYNKSKLLIDWQMGLDFLFDHSFYQGRRDDISSEVEKRAQEILANYVKEKNENPEIILNKENFSEIRSRLMKVIGKGEIGRGRDIDMVISILEFISKINDKNIISYSISRIQNGEIADHFDELQKIHSIGPKCSSFYLRDLNCIYSLDAKITEEDLVCLQPIDVWVRRVASKAGIINDSEKDEELIRKNIIEACSKVEVSAIKFNQGAWYLGHNSFEVLIDNLERI